MSEEHDIGYMLKRLASNLRMGNAPKRYTGHDEPMSEAQRRGWPEWLWPEHEQSDEHKKAVGIFEQTQCAPGEAIRASGLVSLDDTDDG